MPRKNARLFRGRPLLAYAVESCLAAGLFDLVVVTSEDPELLDLAAGLGAVPHPRPAALADDVTPLVPVVREVLDAWGVGDATQVGVVLANPFVRAADLAGGLAMSQRLGGPVASVARLPVPLARTLRADDDGTLSMVAREADRTQDLPPGFHDAGQWYVTSPRELRRQGLLVGAYPYELPRERVVDIDTEDDWRAAELLHAFLESR